MRGFKKSFFFVYFNVVICCSTETVLPYLLITGGLDLVLLVYSTIYHPFLISSVIIWLFFQHGPDTKHYFSLTAVLEFEWHFWKRLELWTHYSSLTIPSFMLGYTSVGKEWRLLPFSRWNEAIFKFVILHNFGNNFVTLKFYEHKRHRSRRSLKDIPAFWWNVSYPFACSTAPSEALRPLRRRHVVHPACRHRSGQCPIVLRWCRETQSPLISPQSSDAIATAKFYERGASWKKRPARRGRWRINEIKVTQTQLFHRLSLVSISERRPKHLLCGLSLVVPPLNAPLRTDGGRRRHAAKIDLAILDLRRSV